MSRRLVLIGGCAIVAVALATYYPASRIGFVNNDWIYLDRVARWSLPQYLYHYLVPGAESGWYRPLFGIYFLVVHVLFGGNASAYHWGYILLHSINGLILFALVSRLSSKRHLALMTALLYVGLPVYSKAVYWPSTPDTLAMVFSLGAIWFWVEYLTTSNPKAAFLSFVAFLLALLSKETTMVLPAALVLIDRLLVRQPASMPDLIRRYAPFGVVWLPYLIMEYALQRSGSYVSLAGYGLGSHLVVNLLNSLAALAFPWRLDTSLGYIALLVVTVVSGWAMLRGERRVLLFLSSMIALNLAPVVGFPTQWFELRYLYGVAMVAALVFAFALYWVWEKAGRQKVSTVLVSGMVALLLFGNGAGTAQAIGEWGEIARQRALPFRDIAASHPTLPDPARLYFIEPPTVSVYDLSVMFLLRYGAGVVVGGTDDSQPNRVARLRDAVAAYVYYFDPAGKPMEIPVAPVVRTSVAPALPATLGASIRLEGYEITRDSLKRGETLALLLYWRAERAVDRDYTVFVHLVDGDGQMVVGHDSQPRGAKAPTSAWVPGTLVADSIVLSIPTDAPTGSNYYLEVGMYTLPKLERQPVTAANGEPATDRIVIAPLQVD